MAISSVRPLLTVKRVIPPVRDGAVARAGPVGRLRAARTRLTVVVAPAGWGKTSTLSGWAADPDEERRIAWVSLDESDDEPARFWTYVLTALREVSDEISEEPLRSLGAADVSPVDLALPVLLNELATATQQHVLVLDDYHVLTDPRIHEAVEFLVSYLPPALRLVIAGRADPPLPLARLRARGDLTELRAGHLRFSPDETAALVSAVAGVPLDADAAGAMWKRTEGWAAGVQLAALALRADPGRLDGDDRHLLDYFAADVLPGLAPRQRELLVRSAPLELLSGPLCDAVLRTTGSADVLAELERADLFVAALDADRQWYRCHRLLRDALRHEAGADPDDVLARAADWFASHDRIDDAVSHLVRAGRTEAAAALLTETAQPWFFERGAAATFLQLGEQLPRSVIGPVLGHTLGYAAALCGRQERVIHWLDESAAGVRPDTELAGWHSFRAAALCMRCTFGVPDADPGLAVELAREALALETAGGGGNPTVGLALGAALVRDGQFDEGVAILLPLWRRDWAGWPPWLVLQVAGTLTVGLVELDRGPECDRVARDAAPVAAVVEREGREAATPGLAHLRTAEGRRRYREADLGGAVESLRRAAALAELHPRSIMLVVALVYLADAELACGDRPAARAALARARDVVDEEGLTGFAASRLAEAEARLGRRSARAAVRSGAVLEELTDRELSILRALQGTASQREIASAHFLSINTVKAYTKGLYRKLGVASRQDAVATGRELGLI
ncbi:LuxR C-terminal-related transcriptional regulator [Cryptosporangium sp. NPDC051539]|uniref:helix-turn-helix transcriptional regulator n=1 Tax=Cryptosporangium sp. NPDC051539 TaxID=3363962 RepID=UPI003798D663